LSRGFIDDISVIGVDGAVQRIIENTLRPIVGKRPLRLAPLERRLLVARQIAGVPATGVLQRSKSTRGASELVVQATHILLGAQVSTNNRGSEFTGPWRYNASATVNPVSMLAERVGVSATFAAQTDELKSGSLSYSQRIGADGMRVSGVFGITKSEPGFTLKQFDAITRSASGDIDLSYPILLQRNYTATAGMGFSYLDSEVELLGDQFSRDRIRTARAVVSFTQTGFLGGRHGGVFELPCSICCVDLIGRRPLMGARSASKRRNVGTVVRRLSRKFRCGARCLCRSRRAW